MAEVWQPSAEEVRSHIPQRVGKPFDATTIPTIVQVDQIIMDIATDITTFVGEAIPAANDNLAKLAAIYGAAADIERAFYPEQADPEGSTYDELRQEYHHLRDRLAQIVGDTSAAGTDTGAPRHSFPKPSTDTAEEFTPLSALRF